MSVAIPIPLLQHLPDVNVTPAVGVDEYALVYDHDTARFVLRAPFSGTPYALLAGRAGGQVLYGGTAANDDITIHGTSDATRTTSYVILQPTAGNVGIGTATPVAKLDVHPGGAQTAGDLVVDTAGKIVYIGRQSVTSGDVTKFVVRSRVGSEIFVIDQANAKSYFTNLYFLGVGTTSPATALHVVGAATVTGGIRPAADSTTALQLQTAAGASVLNVDTTNGRVGIGTSAPGYAVHAQKTVAGVVGIATQNLDATGYAEFRATAPGAEFVFQILGSSFSTVGLLAPTTAYIGGNSAVANVIVGTEKSTGVLQFVIGGVMAANEKMRILSTGFVGIGTTSPATRLDIDAGALTMAEMTAPTGAANKAMLYTKDNGSGKTQLCCKLGDDVEVILATQS